MFTKKISEKEKKEMMKTLVTAEEKRFLMQKKS